MTSQGLLLMAAGELAWMCFFFLRVTAMTVITRSSQSLRALSISRKGQKQTVSFQKEVAHLYLLREMVAQGRKRPIYIIYSLMMNACSA